MYIVPSTATLGVGSTITMEVWVGNAVDLYAYEFKLQYNGNYLTFISPPIDSDFLKTPLINTFFAYTYDPQAGIITVACTRLGEVPGFTGTAKAADLNFRAVIQGAGQTTPLTLIETRMIDSGLNDIPTDAPGNAVIQIIWPLWLMNTELYLSAAKGGKLWTLWQTGKLVTNPIADPNSPYYDPDPYWLDYPLMWPDQILYARVRNLGTEPTGANKLYIRVRFTLIDLTTGWVQSKYSTPTAIDANSEAVVGATAGLVDSAYEIFYPYEDFQQYPSTWFTIGRVQISLDLYNFYDWTVVIINGQHLPGDYYSKDVPGGSSGKFHVLP